MRRTSFILTKRLTKRRHERRTWPRCIFPALYFHHRSHMQASKQAVCGSKPRGADLINSRPTFLYMVGSTRGLREGGGHGHHRGDETFSPTICQLGAELASHSGVLTCLLLLHAPAGQDLGANELGWTSQASTFS